MDYTSEERFVRSFIKKERRERLLYEFTTPEKRYDAVDRFCHSAGKLIDPRKIAVKGDGMDRSAAFREFVANHDELCLVLSPDFYMDEQFLPLETAVRMAAMSTDSVLILGSGFAVVFGEAEKGGREKYLLCESPEF
ncbi:MAG: hypothetical protein IKD89_07240 [Clostridia bacterium]|nr:hypothetical protein [Clostridia bacterium]